MSHFAKLPLLKKKFTKCNKGVKLDSGTRNSETYAFFPEMLLNFIRPIGNSTYNNYDPLEITLLTRLWIGFSYFSEHKFGHNFGDSLNLVLWKLSLHLIFPYAAKIILFMQSPYDWFKKY